jgi:hypothetical protein
MCGPVFFGPNSIGLFTAILVHVIDGPSQLPPSFVEFLTGFPAGSFLPAAGQARDRNMAITKTDKKTKKSEPTASKPEAAKTETAKTESQVPASEADATSGAGGKKSSAPSRPISYFSSVSSDDYRSGWDNIFSSGRNKSTRTRKPVKSAAAKRTRKLPASISLGADDLDPATREQLEAVFRRHAKKKRLNYDKLSDNGQVNWEISCHISST